MMVAHSESGMPAQASMASERGRHARAAGAQSQGAQLRGASPDGVGRHGGHSVAARFRPRPGFLVLAALYALAMVVGRRFAVAEAADESYWLAALQFLGWFVLLAVAVHLAGAVVHWLAGRRRETVSGATSSLALRAYAFVFERHPVLVPFVVLLVCWLPYVVILYPGTVDPFDNLDQFCQMRGVVFRTSTWQDPIDPNVLLNNNNPAFHTVLLNAFVFAGEAIGSQNIGFFAFTGMQVCLMALALALAVSLQEDFGNTRPFTVGLLLFFSLNPLFPIWSMCATKDVLFTIVTLHYVILAVRVIRHPDEYGRGRWLALFFVLALLMMLVRNNGLFAVAFSIPAYALVKHVGTRRVAAVLAAALAAYFVYLYVVLPAAYVTPGNVRETLAVPFQQTARYLVYHGDDVTPDERAAIDAVLDYDAIAERYNPNKVDAVKETANKYATRDDLANYLSAWASMGVRHPVTYVSATAANTYRYFYPGEDSSWIWVHFGWYGEENIVDKYHEAGVDIHQNDMFWDTRSSMREVYLGYSHSPWGLLTNMALMAWGILFMCVVVAGTRSWRPLIPFLPYLTLMLVCMMCPENGNSRYTLPYVLAVAFLFSYTVACVRSWRADDSLEDAPAGASAEGEGIGSASSAGVAVTASRQAKDAGSASASDPGVGDGTPEVTSELRTGGAR